MHFERFWVGGIECWRFLHDRGRGTPAWMFPDVPAEALATRLGRNLDVDGTFGFVYSSLLIRAGRHLALFDTSDPARGADEQSSIDRFLAAIGVRPTEVGTVVISHGHVDHIGGLVRSGEPVFGRARHFIDRRELEYWTSGGQAGEEAAFLLKPVVDAGLVDVVDGEHEVLPGVRLLPTPGHTPGHLATAINSEEETAMYVGDVLAHEVNVPEPDWNHFSDMLPGPAASSRRWLVERAARDSAIVIGSHLMTRGRVSTTPSGGFAYDIEDIGDRLTAA